MFFYVVLTIWRFFAETGVEFGINVNNLWIVFLI
ncbi:hypothetical protein TH47_08185 [Thalassospira sp. MCCC 1A02803]|nr:hypothetical protein TH47_08185 [Thalassospira sp. MCCC 1A02803]